MMNNILITGGAGFIGVNTARKFLNNKFKVILIDNFSRKGTKQNIKILLNEISTKKQNLKIINVDIRNFTKTSNIIKKYKPNLILHLAAQVAVTTSILNPRDDMERNIIGSFNLLESCRLHSIKSLLIYSSTNKVYGKINKKLKINKTRYLVNKEHATDEKQSLDFYSPYGCSKGAADQYFHDYNRIYGLNTIVLRQSCIYGENQFGVEDQGWVAWFIIAFILKKKLTIYGNGKQVRDLLYIGDLTDLYLKLYQNRKKCSGKIYNIGGGLKNALSLLELINILKKRYNLNTKIKFDKKARDGDQPIFISNNNKIKKDINWEPKVNIQKGLNKIEKWTQDNIKLIKKTLN